MPDEFHTLKGYQALHHPQVTAAMEDYLEMICRDTRKDGCARITQISQRLNVKPSSASKMAGKLKELDLVDFERYGCIQPTKKGLELGCYLLRRHKILEEFLCFLNKSETELEQVEQIEHFLTPETIFNLERLLNRMKNEQKTGKQEK